MLLNHHLWSSITAFLLVPVTFSQSVITPFADGQCVNELTNFTYSDIESWAPAFGLGSGYPNVKDYVDVQFTGANSPNNAEGYTVYWKVETPDPGCRVIFQLPFTDKGYGATSNDEVLGNNILNVGSAGCYYTNLPVKAELYTTFCCGTGDCTALSAGNPAIVIRSLDEELSPESVDSVKDIDIEPEITAHVGSVTSRALSAARKPNNHNLLSRTTCTDIPCLDAAWAECTVQAGPAYPKAGSQVAISPSQSCPADTNGVCSVAASSSLTTGISMSTSSDTTVTNESGVDLSVTAGVDWPVAAETTAGVSYSLAQSVANSAGKSLDNSTTFTVTNTIGQVSGTKAFMTFTPSFDCYEPHIVCANIDGYFTEVCWPNMLENGVQDGDYGLVYID